MLQGMYAWPYLKRPMRNHFLNVKQSTDGVHLHVGVEIHLEKNLLLM